MPASWVDPILRRAHFPTPAAQVSGVGQRPKYRVKLA
jgi:hypothetical protein